jgi:hypothetical protein
VYLGSGQWKPDLQSEAAIASAALRMLGGPGSEVTVMGVPKGSGQRMGIDRDRDGYLDGDERLAGSDPGDPSSTPANVGLPRPGAGGDLLHAVRPNPFRDRTEVHFTLGRAGPVDCLVHDLLGRQVRSLARGQWFEAGAHRLLWDGRTDRGEESRAGVYFLRLRTHGDAGTRTLVRMR